MEENKNTTGTVKFMLMNIDNDGIVEMGIVEGEGHLNAIEIITYTNGKIVNCGKYGRYGSISYVPKGNLFASEDSSLGIIMYGYYSLDKGKVIEKLSLMEMDSYLSSDGVTHWFKNGKEISISEYNKLLKHYENDYKWSEASFSRAWTVSEYNLEQLKKNYSKFIV